MRTALTAIVAATLIASPASAAVFTYIVTGTVTGGSTEGNPAFGDGYIGSSFSARFEVDDALPAAIYAADANGSSGRGGGLVQAGTRPPVTATLTINGIGYAIRTGERKDYPVCYPDIGECFGSTWIEDDRGEIAKDAAARRLTLGAGYKSFDSTPGLFFRNESDALDFALNGAALSAPDYRQGGTFAVTGTGSFATTYDLVAYSGGSQFDTTRLSLAPTLLTVSGSVPEPAGWAMMIAGFAVVGGALRARRRVGVPATIRCR